MIIPATLDVLRVPIYPKHSFWVDDTTAPLDQELIVHELRYYPEPFLTSDEVKGVPYIHGPMVPLNKEGTKALFFKIVNFWRCERCRAKFLAADAREFYHRCNEELEGQ